MLVIEGRLKCPIQHLEEIGSPFGIVVDAEQDGIRLYRADGFDHATAGAILVMTPEEWELVDRALSMSKENAVAVPDDVKGIVGAFRYIQSNLSTSGIFANAAKVDAMAMELTQIWARQHFGKEANDDKTRSSTRCNSTPAPGGFLPGQGDPGTGQLPDPDSDHD